ncbi:hypothetical protein RGC53_08310, partial [Helicobacter pylori]
LAKAIGYDVVNVNTDAFWTTCAELCRYAKTGELPAGATDVPSTMNLAVVFGLRTEPWPELPRLVVEAGYTRWHIYAGDRVSAKS